VLTICLPRLQLLNNNPPQKFQHKHRNTLHMALQCEMYCCTPLAQHWQPIVMLILRSYYCTSALTNELTMLQHMVWLSKLGRRFSIGQHFSDKRTYREYDSLKSRQRNCQDHEASGVVGLLMDAIDMRRCFEGCLCPRPGLGNWLTLSAVARHIIITRRRYSRVVL
jgi:hypothetical protein